MGSMQLFNKASKKSRNLADDAQASAPEKIAAADMTSKPRTTRSSKTKKTETAETGSVKHHHKAVSAVTLDSGTDISETRTLAAAAGAGETAAGPQVTNEEIAKLAYIYWIERGYVDGGAEQDWLRAERELNARR